jgi:hypothetical protein
VKGYVVISDQADASGTISKRQKMAKSALIVRFLDWQGQSNPARLPRGRGGTLRQRFSLFAPGDHEAKRQPTKAKRGAKLARVRRRADANQSQTSSKLKEPLHF